MSTAKKKRRKPQYVWYLFLLPTLAGIVLFMAYPVLESFRLSFYNSNGTIERWVGLFNYQRIFTSASFWYAVYTTFYVAFFQLAIAIPLGFLIASLINEVRMGKNVLKVIFFIPYVTSIVAAAMIFLFVLHPGKGLLNHFLSLAGLPTSAWLAEPTSARWGAIILTVWHWLGFVVIICLANLQAIALELYEAAMIDGANGIQQWRYITIPQMKGCFAFLVVMGWISGLQRFTEMYVLGGHQGSPARALFTIVGFIFERGFSGNEFGLASAATYVLFLMIILFTLLNLKLTKLEL